MFISFLQTIGPAICHCRPTKNLLTIKNSFVRVISSSTVRDKNRDKYEDIWANDFDSFLKMPKSKEVISSDDDSNSGSNSSSSSSEQEQKSKKRPRKEVKKSEKSEDKSVSKKKQSSSSKNDDDDKDKTWELGNKKRVAITEFRGTSYVDIREMYLDKNSGDLKPGTKGISLNSAQWEKLKENIEAIDKVVKSK